MGIIERTKNAFNAFKLKDSRPNQDVVVGGQPDDYYYSYSGPPMPRAQRYSRGSIIDSTLNRIAIDVAELNFYHVKMDKDPTTETIQKSGLNRCLTEEANIDQSHIDFIQDLVVSMFDEGVIAAVPIDTDEDPTDNTTLDIYSMRVGKITRWEGLKVEVEAWNERKGTNERFEIDKRNVAIIQNPMYAVINADNATLKRLMRKLQLIDIHDEKNASNKLNLILQTPQPMKTDKRKDRAKVRVQEVSDQLASSDYGIAYIGAEEKITQLGQGIDNHLLEEINSLREEFWNQLGMTKAILDGTANEEEKQFYYVRTVYPIANRIKAEFIRKFLSDTAKTQGHTIVYYSDPLKFVPASQIPSMGDALRRNEIASSNEIRKPLGLPPADDPKADLIFNPNMPSSQDAGVNGAAEGGAVEDLSEEDLQILDTLNDDQMAELAEYIKEQLGVEEIDDSTLDNLSDDEVKMVVEKAKEIAGGTEEPSADEETEGETDEEEQ